MNEENQVRSPFAIASLALGLMPYPLVGILFAIFELVTDLGTWGLSLMLNYIAVIAACPTLGLLFALLALRRDIGTEWPPRRPAGPTLVALTFNIFNGSVLVLARYWLLQ